MIKGSHHTEEIKQILRERSLGKKQSQETIQKRVNKLRGQKRSEEFRKECRLHALEQFKDGMPQETKDKLSRIHTGMKQTEEHKRNVSKAKKGHPCYKSKERSIKLSIARKGKKAEEIYKDAETWKRNMGLAKRGDKHPKFRGDISIEIILKTIKEIINENKGNIGRGKLIKLFCQKLNCSDMIIRGRCHSLESLLNKANINLPKLTTKIDFTKQDILLNTLDIINRYEISGREQFKNLLQNRLNCQSFVPISREFKNVDAILKELNMHLPRGRKWKQKEDLIEDVIKEYEGNIQTQQYHKGIGTPDIETKDKIYEAKSYLYMGWQDQLDRYTQLNKDVKFVVFEDKGKTDIPRERIIVLKELVKDLPDNKRLLIQERIERIKRDIPLEQINLKEVLNK